jgi:hypothetical protein
MSGNLFNLQFTTKATVTVTLLLRVNNIGPGSEWKVGFGSICFVLAII